MPTREIHYIVRCGNGEYVAPKCVPHGVDTTPNIKQARKFGGKRARRWVKRHPWLNPILLTTDGQPAPEEES